MANKLRLKLVNDDYVRKIIAEQPEQMEKSIKKELRKEGKSLVQTAKNKLKKYQRKPWILEDTLITQVSGSFTKGRGKNLGRLKFSIGFKDKGASATTKKFGRKNKNESLVGTAETKSSMNYPSRYGWKIDAGNRQIRRTKATNPNRMRAYRTKKGWKTTTVKDAFNPARDPRPFLSETKMEAITSGRMVEVIQMAIENAVETFNKEQK